MTPRVSVVIPNYNYARYLAHAVTSALEQSFRDLELIVVDNFSSDDSEAVVSANSDPRVSFHTFANDGVIARSRNFGLSLAQGEFVAFLDSDDSWFAAKLSVQLQAMKEETFAAYHDLRAIKRGFPQTIRGFEVGDRPLERMLTAGNPIPLSSVLCRTDLLRNLGGFPESEDLVGVEDFALWLRAGAQRLEFRYIPKTLGAYRIHNSVSSSFDTSQRTEMLVTSYASFLNDKQIRLSKGFVSYSKAKGARSKNDGRQEYRFLIECIRSNNWRFVWRAIMRLGANALHSRWI